MPQHLSRSLLPVLVAVLTAAVPVTSAAADTTGSVDSRDGTIDSHAGRHDRSGSGGGSGGPVCEYRPLKTPPSKPMWYRDRHNIPIDDGTGSWFSMWCDSSFYGVVYISRTRPADLLVDARRRLNLPKPTPQFNPAGDQLVNVATWLWISTDGWRTQTSTATVPGVAVTVTARPVAAVWSLGDGTTVRCTGPGTPFDANNPGSRSECSATYRHSSANEPDLRFHGSVTVEWHADWIAAGAAGGGTLAPLFQSSAFSLSVTEVQALNRSGVRR